MSTGVRVAAAYTAEELAQPQRVADRLRSRGVRLETDEVVRLAELLGRPPSWPEAVLFGILWSEHCSYKSTRHLLRRLPTTAPQVVLGPGEDAGVVSLPEPCASTLLVLAHESHNHPSQVLPVEGAATGIGGIVRDVVCMGAHVAGVLDSLRFGDPRAGVRVRDIVRGVVQGVADYANPLGVPNLGGDVCFDSGYDRNCLVNVMAVGLVPATGLLRSRVPEGEGPWAFVLVGKPTDSSGFGGAAFASDALGDVDDRGAVQLPDPFLKRVLNVAHEEAFERIRARGIPAGFKDLGAGGVACATSELAAAGGRGARIALDDVHRVESPLPPEVLLCAETQERYCWVVPAAFAPELCAIYNVEFALGSIYPGAAARVIGEPAADGRYQVRWRGETIVDCAVTAITAGREVVRPSRRRTPEPPGAWAAGRAAPALLEALPALLGGLELCSREYLYRHYDSEVQGRTWLRPGEADAVVIRAGDPPGLGLAFAVGGNPAWCAADPELGARHAVAEAARNVATVGARPWALTDCLNYGDALDPSVMGDLEAGVEGLAAAARALGGLAAPGHALPFVSGNVSLYNHADGGSIPPSPIVMCAGVLANPNAALPVAITRAGDLLARIGEPADTLTGSAWLRAFGRRPAGAPPPLDLAREAALQAFAVEAAASGWATAAHDVSDGGSLVALVEMLLAGPEEAGLGAEIEVAGDGPLEARMFCERPAIVYAVRPDRRAEFDAGARRRGFEPEALGRVTASGRLRVAAAGVDTEWELRELRAAAAAPLERLWNEEMDG